MRKSIKGAIAAAAALGIFAGIAMTSPVSAALMHGGGFHGGGFHGGGFRGFHGGFARGFHGGGFHGFHGGFARGFHGGHFHALMAGRHWGHWGRHGGFAANRFSSVPHGFAGGLGRNWPGRGRAAYGAVWAGYGGYGGYGDWGGYYTDYDGLWAGDVFGLAGLAAGLAIDGGDCLIYTPVYDNLGRYLGIEPVNLCSL
jgi:hypothetical protein